MAKTGQDDTDYDRQFQEDLEKAQALSLETLALEKFRMEKLKMELHRYQSQTERDPTMKILKQERSFSRESSVDSTISTSIESRSRPRPGSFNTGGPCVYQIKPPPAGRRNSVATPATSDLISFHSPTNTNHAPADTDSLDQFHSSNNGNTTSSLLADHPIKNLSSVPSTSLRSGFRDIGFDMNSLGSELSGIMPLSSTPSFPAAPPPGFFIPPNPTSYPSINPYMFSFNLPRPPSLPATASTSASTSNPTSSTIFNGTSSSLNVLKAVEKRDNSNLIDLTLFDSEVEPQRDRGVRVSLLEAFDPLLTPTHSQMLPEDPAMREDQSECSSSVYDPYDPFDYLYSPPSIAGSQASDPIYAAVVKASPLSPPPLPPRNTAAKLSAERKSHRQSKLYDNVLAEKQKPTLADPDLEAFHTMVKALRAEFVYSDPYTNVGLVISPLIESSYLQGTSVKLTVHCPDKDQPLSFTSDTEFVYSDPYTNVGLVISPLIESSYLQGTSVKLTVHCPDKDQPLSFTSDVSCSVDLVMEQIVCGLLDAGSPTDYVLKVWGLAEFITSHTQLSDYEYVHQCIKLEQDIRLVLVHVDSLPRPLARTPQDDERDKDLTLEDLLPKEPVQPISYETLQILLETLEREMERVEASVADGGEAVVQPRKVTQSVKAVCALLGSVETLDITQALEAFNRACGQLSQTPQEEAWGRPEIVDEDGDYSVVLFRGEVASETISGHCERIRDAVQGLIQTYALAFRVDFQIRDFSTPNNGTQKLSSEVLDTVLVHVECLHRLSANWTHDTYMVAGQLYHGTRPVGHPVLSKPTAPSRSLYNRIVFDSWLNFEGTSVCELPRECRLVLVIYGRSVTPTAEGDTATGGEMTQVELGWSAVQFFNYDGVLVQGTLLLSVWPPGADKRLGPAPASGTQPHGDTHPVLGVELPDYGSRVEFPPLIKEVDQASFSPSSHDFESLDGNTQELLKDIVAQDTFTRPLLEDREILWEKRHYLKAQPQALPKVLLAAHSWDYACLSDLHAMLHTWAPLEPVSALQLLLPCFPDSEVRRVAVSWIQGLSSDELVDYLPQLVQALKHETYEASPLARLLLERALTSPRVAHHLYWLLTQALPGASPQNSSEVGTEDQSVCEARYFRRLQLILRALLAISGEAPRERFMSQQLLVKNLYEVAETVKTVKESLRLKALVAALEGLHGSLEATNTCLPLSPSTEVSGVHVRSCSYFPSNTLPLKISFHGADSCIIPAIFKVGDDLQQDMLTLQMIRIMDKLWLREGLDLKMVTFACVPTGTKRGMIEMVTEAETLRKIQVELGLTGSFKDRPIAEWLAKHNPSALEYERAVANFTASCAGYSVATYVLGICDRHNDNIMLKTSGHLFHIDFGKFLGDAQMFGNFKRDRTPFVLTSDMAYVINGGDKPSAKFHHFVDLCCQAFNIVRKHGNLILNLFGLMASSGISGVTMDAVRYIQRSLLLDLTNPEAAAMFARMIQSSLKSWFTQFNFFLHNLAQLRFTGDHNDGELLSFVPRTYSMAAEGRLHSVEVYGYQKRYDPDKYYTYILRVQRVYQRDPTYLFRSYKEFVEFQQKLCIHFPLAKCYSLQSTSLHMGRSNIKQVAEKRLVDIKRFLTSLFKMADEICHSDLVYTFFHPLLRDQQEASIHEQKLKERKKERIINSESWRLRGQLKLSVHYQRGTLMVMVHHARELPTASSGQEPSTYIKVYLLPDPHKQTKRKTKVVRKSCHPSFMEMLEYRMPLEIVQHRVLQATVWNHDPLQENEFLGGVSLPLESLDLGRETVQWYALGNVHR